MTGQVNISMDGVGDAFGVNGRSGSFDKADAAIRALRAANVAVGINCVVSAANFSSLRKVVAYAARRGCNEVEFLKYKPAGRGATHYMAHALSQEQIRAFYPLVQKLSRRALEIKIDCSFIPALAFHRPPPDLLEKLAVSGCDGGNMLLAVRSNGMFSGCSFVCNSEPVEELPARWDASPHLGAFRSLERDARQPCRNCAYPAICRCGCRASSLFHTGDFSAPDPECPFVHDFIHDGKYAPPAVKITGDARQ